MASPLRSHVDMMNGDASAGRRPDTECLRLGIYALPGVRRFFSTVYGVAEVEDTVQILDEACLAFKTC